MPIVLVDFPVLALCVECHVNLANIPVTGGDVCVDCDKITLREDVDCADCEYEWHADVHAWLVSELCYTCQAEDAPWAEADRRHALTKEGEDY